MNTLEKILHIDSEILELEKKKRDLGNDYLKENCPYKLGEKIIVEDESGTTAGIIFKIDFDLHSNIKGLARIGILPINKKGLRIIDRNGLFFNDVISIKSTN